MDSGAAERPADPAALALELAGDFATRAEAHDRDASFPFENFDRLAAAGLLNLVTPADFGGQGRGLLDAARVVGAIASGDASTALVLAMHYLHLSYFLRSDDWPRARRQAVAAESLSGAALVNVLRVEPELGTPARGGLPATRLVRAAGGWRVSGHKIYSTGAPLLRWGLVWAASDETEPRLGYVLVPLDAPGVSVEESWNHLGLRASGSHDVVLADVFVPDDHVGALQPPGATLPDPEQLLRIATLLAAVYDGVARAARDWLVDFLKRRAPANLGAPLATVPRLQEALGEIEVLLAANRLLIDAVASAADRDPAGATQQTAYTLKTTVTGNAIAAVEKALKVSGNPGLSRANRLERHYRDVLCGRVHTPQDDSAFTALGRLALGL